MEAGVQVYTHSHRLPSPLEQVRADLLGIDPESKGAQTTRLHLAVLEKLFTLYDFLFVGLGDEAFKGGLRLYAKPHKAHTYTTIKKTLVRRLIVEAGRQLTPKVSLTGAQVKQILDTFVDRPPILTTIERRVFQVSHNLFFNLDAPEGHDQLVHGSQLPSDAKCFFRLFDSVAEDKDVVIYPASTFDSSFSRKVQSAYDSLLVLLEKYDRGPDFGLPEASLSATRQDDDPLPRHFKFIEEWADGNPGLYWDLMTLPATIFMKEKPQISYFLSGTGANGKSAYLGLIHSMLGTKNTTRNRVSEMSNYHLNTLLQYTLFNAPDDEGDKMFDNEDSLRIFKSFSSHATVSLPIMYSQEPMELKADFMSAHPMNAAPDWGDISSASALTRRTCLIPFTADFKNKSAPIANFAKATFTPDVLAQFTGETLALASFYSTHQIKWSATVTAAHDRVEEENDSIGLYKKAWERFFVSFQNMGILYDDYRCWCAAHDLQSTKDTGAFKTHWFEYTSHPDKAYVTGVGFKKLADRNGKIERKNTLSTPSCAVIRRDRQKRKLPPMLDMLEETILPFKSLERYGPIGQMHHTDDIDKAVGKSSFSAVALLEGVENSGY